MPKPQPKFICNDCRHSALAHAVVRKQREEQPYKLISEIADELVASKKMRCTKCNSKNIRLIGCGQKKRKGKNSDETNQVMHELCGALARREITSTFSENLVRDWEAGQFMTFKQISAAKKILSKIPKGPRTFSGGGTRKSGSHKSNW